MSQSPGTDRNVLTQKAYANDEMLAIRQRTHDLYSMPKLDFSSWVLDRIEWRGDEQVLDIGAGPGTYFEPLLPRIPHGRLIAGDLSIGMARKAAHHAGDKGHIFNGDAQVIPFRSGTFDVVLANHMLYHVPDLDEALSEIRRVLKPDGCLIAATNSQFNLPEFDQLTRRAFNLLGVSGPEAEAPRSIVQQFSLEEGAPRLARHFFGVARFDLPGALVFSSAQPAVDYINSTRPLREPQLPRRVSWDDFIAVMNDQITRMINLFGELIVNKLTGVLVATDGGAFIKDYAQLHATKIE